MHSDYMHSDVGWCPVLYLRELTVDRDLVWYKLCSCWLVEEAGEVLVREDLFQGLEKTTK